MCRSGEKSGHRPAAAPFDVSLDEIDDGGAGKGREPDPRRERRMQSRCAAVVAMTDLAQKAPARVGGRSSTNRPHEQRGEGQGGHGLHCDQEERVVVGTRVGERRDVQRTVEPRRQAPSRHLGNDDEECKRRKPSPA